jgi:hypothetical protein
MAQKTFPAGSDNAKASSAITTKANELRELLAARVSVNPKSERCKVQLGFVDQLLFQEELLPAEFEALDLRARKAAAAAAVTA